VVYARRRVLRLLDTAAARSFSRTSTSTHNTLTSHNIHTQIHARMQQQKQRVIKITSNDEIEKNSGGRRDVPLMMWKKKVNFYLDFLLR
jgi:hypothetical protein